MRQLFGSDLKSFAAHPSRRWRQTKFAERLGKSQGTISSAILQDRPLDVTFDFALAALHYRLDPLFIPALPPDAPNRLRRDRLFMALYNAGMLARASEQISLWSEIADEEEKKIVAASTQNSLPLDSLPLERGALDAA